MDKDKILHITSFNKEDVVKQLSGLQAWSVNKKPPLSSSYFLIKFDKFEMDLYAEGEYQNFSDCKTIDISLWYGHEEISLYDFPVDKYKVYFQEFDDLPCELLSDFIIDVHKYGKLMAFG